MLEQRQHRAQRPSFDKNRSAQPRFCASVVVVVALLTHFSHQFHTIENSFVYLYVCTVYVSVFVSQKYIGQFYELNENHDASNSFYSTPSKRSKLITFSTNFFNILS